MCSFEFPCVVWSVVCCTAAGAGTDPNLALLSRNDNKEAEVKGEQSSGYSLVVTYTITNPSISSNPLEYI